MKNRGLKVFLFCVPFLFIFSACNISNDEKAEAVKILEIREDLLNKGDIDSLALLLTDNFPDRKKFVSQLKYRYQYFHHFSYDINSLNVIDSSNVLKKITFLIDHDLSYKTPDDVAEVFWLGRKEEVVMKKEDIGWKISSINEIKDTGRKIDAQTVHDIFFALDTRKTALNNGDVELFETIIDEKFPERELLVDNFKKNAEAFINVNYGLNGRRFQYISDKTDEARVIQYFDLVFTIKGLDESEKIEDQKEIISLSKKSDGTWKITDGLK